jgi:hypothetical protein
MQVRIKVLNLFIVVLVFVCCSSCASIMSTSRQLVPFYSTPEGATIVINDSVYGKTPLHIDMKRKRRGRDVRLKLDGYETYYVYMHRTLNPWVLGNILIGGLIGLGIDAISGAMYEVYPDHVSVELKKTVQQ